MLALLLATFLRTQWGMPLAQIEKLYPGGTERPQNDAVIYSVEHAYLGLPARCEFVTARSFGLLEVHVLYPAARYKRVQRALKKKYGGYFEDHWWIDGDFIAVSKDAHDTQVLIRKHHPAVD